MAQLLWWFCLNQAHLNAIKSNTHLPPPIRGIWSVDEFTLDGVPQPPLLTNSERWQRVIFDAPETFFFQLMDSEIVNYDLHLIPPERVSLWLLPGDATDIKGSFAYEYPEPDHMLLDGSFKGHHVNVSLHRTDLAQFLLLNRGLHMINQVVNNR